MDIGSVIYTGTPENELAESALSMGDDDYSSPYMIGSRDEGGDHTVIKKNLKIVSLICNTFTIGMCVYLLYKLWKAIGDSKTNS